VLLYGPPGTGKTLLARAVAHHTDCTFIRVSGSELVQKYIGEGSRMVRELFVMARSACPQAISCRPGHLNSLLVCFCKDDEVPLDGSLMGHWELCRAGRR
jgi:DNA polymerase III delta prime subunit